MTVNHLGIPNTSGGQYRYDALSALDMPSGLDRGVLWEGHIIMLVSVVGC